MSLKFTVILMPEAKGHYSVVCPALPGCVSQGDNLEEALANIREAAEGWLEVWLEDEKSVPVETPEIVADEVRQCLRDRAEDGLSLVLETREVQIPNPVPA